MSKRARSSEVVSIRVPDQWAVRILINTYWHRGAWRPYEITAGGGVRLVKSITPSDFAYARAAGVMFDDRHFSRAEIQEWLITERERCSPQSVASAFLSSMSTRRLDLRSALGSFTFARHFPRHVCDNSFSVSRYCSICGLSEASGQDVADLSVLNFERFKWGGVRHSGPLYAALDLWLLRSVDVPTPTASDVAMLSRILALADSMPSDARPNQLAAQLKGVFASNEAERRVLIEILSLCGVLEPARSRSYRQGFVTAIDREAARPLDHKNDWHYPAILWRGSDGVDWTAVAEWFPAVPHGVS